MLTKQNVETELPLQKETAAIKQVVNYSEVLPPPAPPAKSAITIISKPVAEPKKQPIIPIITSKENSLPDSETENSAQAGITKIGKQPTPKESREMNSQGIVLY